MVKKLLTTAALAATVMIGPQIAEAAGPVPQHQAQWRGDHGGWNGPEFRRGWQRHRLDADDVRRILHRHGYREVRVVDRDRFSFTALAERRRSSFVVVVSAFDGRILDVERLRSSWRGHGGWNNRGPGRGWDRNNR